MGIHERFESVADVYLAGGLEPSDRDDVLKHTGDCAACATSLRDAQEFRTWIRGSLAPDSPPADLEERIIVGLRKHDAAPRSTGRKWFWLVKVAAGVAIAVSLMVFGDAYQNPGRFSPGAPMAAESARTVGEGRGGTRTYAGGVEGGETLGLSEVSLKRLEAKTKGLASESPKAQGNFALKDGVMRESDHNESADNEDYHADKSADRKAEKKNAFGSPAEIRKEIQDNRKIIYSADLQVEVEAYEAAYKKIGEIVSGEKGFIAGANTQKLANGKIRATVTIRIPPDKFDATLSKLGELGTVRNRSIATQDVTKAYTDLDSRLRSKLILVERLAKILAEAKGTVKELMEVEVQMQMTNEQIEVIKGELKYFDNLVGMSTITMHVFEKDLGQPFEFVQTLQSTIGVTALDVQGVYAQAQKVVTDAGGQVSDSRMTVNNDGSVTGSIQARVDAEKFPAVREALKKLGHVDTDTVNQQRTARGGNPALVTKPDAPVKREQAVIDMTIATPMEITTKGGNVSLETSEVEKAYNEARSKVESQGGKIIDSSLQGHANGATARIRAKMTVDKFAGMMDTFKALGTKVKNATVKFTPPGADNKDKLLKEMAEIDLTIESPKALIQDENSIGQTIKDTFSKSIAGLMESVQKLIVGAALAAPWIVLILVGVVIWRKARKAKKATA